MIGPALVSTSFLCFTPKATLCRNETGMLSSNVYQCKIPTTQKVVSNELVSNVFSSKIQIGGTDRWVMRPMRHQPHSRKEGRLVHSPWQLGNFNEKLWRINFSKSMGPYKYGQGVAGLYSRTPLAIVRLKYTCHEFNLGSRDTPIKSRCCRFCTFIPMKKPNSSYG